MTLQVGDKVQLKSGGPIMTVAIIDEGGVFCDCIRFPVGVTHTLSRDSFPCTTLLTIE